MKFTASVPELKLALTKAKTTISQKDAQPVLRNFCFKLEKNILTIFATDLNLATVCKVDVVGERDGVITVPGDKLFSIVSNATVEEITLDVQNNACLVTTGKFAATLQCLSADDFPEIEEFAKEDPLSIDKSSFLENLNRISFSISDNEARRNLLAVYINDGFIQASDGHVSSVCKFDTSVGQTLIPSLAVPDLVRVLRNSSAENIELATTDSFLMFKLDSDVFITRLSQANFPDIPNKVLKPTEKNPILLNIDKKTLIAAINRVAVTSNKSSLAVNFKVEGTTLFLKSGDVEGNSSSEDFEIESNENIEFNLNYEYVLDICKSISSETISMAIHSSVRVPIRIQDGEFVALLMRLATQAPKTD